MQYFDRDGKYNFVDENNVFVGYDSHQDCCEYAGWMLRDEPMFAEFELPDDEAGALDWENWVFDPLFFEEFTAKTSDYDENGAVMFRLVPKDGRRKGRKYLILFNVQNGYYGHGFEVKIGGVLQREGTL